MEEQDTSIPTAYKKARQYQDDSSSAPTAGARTHLVSNLTTDPNPLANLEPLSSDHLDDDISSDDDDSKHSHKDTFGEPSLRFPRPVGSRHLANWISTSDPDIMRITTETVNDDGLADSTYELVTQADDTASENSLQDGNYDESFSESVSSLDIHRSDTGTEILSESEDTPIIVQQQLHLRTPSPHMVADSHLHGASDTEADTDSDSDTASKSSMEYTHESLETPSLNASQETPKASAMWKRRPDPYGVRAGTSTCLHYVEDAIDNARAWFRETDRRMRNEFARLYHDLELSRTQLWSIAFATLLLLILNLVAPRYDMVPTEERNLIDATDGKAVPVIATRDLTRVTEEPQPVIPVQRSYMNFDSFVFKSFELSFILQGTSLVITSDASDWKLHDCLSVAATRAGRDIEVTTETTHDTVTARLPLREKYGTVVFAVESTCRSIKGRNVEVFLGGMTENFGAFAAQTKDLVLAETKALVPYLTTPVSRVAQSLRPIVQHSSDVMAKTRHEALTWAKGTMSALSNMPSKKKMCALCALPTKYLVDEKTLRSIAETAKETAHNVPKDVAKSVRQVHSVLQIALLRRQLDAKLWWLRVNGRHAEHQEYQLKAQRYLASKVGTPGDDAAAATKKTTGGFILPRQGRA